MHEKYVVLGERMEALVKEEQAARGAAQMESEAARLVVQVSGAGAGSGFAGASELVGLAGCSMIKRVTHYLRILITEAYA